MALAWKMEVKESRCLNATSESESLSDPSPFCGLTVFVLLPLISRVAARGSPHLLTTQTRAHC